MQGDKLKKYCSKHLFFVDFSVLLCYYILDNEVNIAIVWIPEVVK